MNTTGTMLLRPKRGKWLLVGLGSLTFVLTGIWLVRAGNWVGWLSIAFFGLGFLVSLLVMLPRAAYLKLTPESFTVCSLFKPCTLRWAEVKDFAVGRLLTNKMVMFNLEGSADSLPRSAALRSLNVRMCGFEAALPDSYGLTHEELAGLLNAYRASALGA